MKNGCPYLNKYKYCSHKTGGGVCIYSNPEKCSIWQDSPSNIIKFFRGAKNYLKQRFRSKDEWKTPI